MNKRVPGLLIVASVATILMIVPALSQSFTGPATITQPTTAGNCVKIGPQGANNLVDAGSPCAGGSGTVTNVSGTTNQIDVATGTSTPVLSLSSTIVTPGTIAIGGGSAITSSGPGGALTSTAFTATGTSGATVPLLSTANTWSAIQTDTGLTGTSPGWYAQITGDTTPRVRVGVNANDVGSIGFGSGSTTRDLFLERAGAATSRWGGNDTTAPVAQTQGVQNVVTGTSNTAGALWKFIDSGGTGSATSGGFEFDCHPLGGAGSTPNVAAACLTISGQKAVAMSGTLAIGAGSAITSSGAGGALGTNAFTSTAYAPIASPTFTGTQTLTTALATTVAIGGATIGTDALGVTGTATFSATTTIGSGTFSANSLTYAASPTGTVTGGYSTVTNVATYNSSSDSTTSAGQLTAGSFTSDIIGQGMPQQTQGVYALAKAEASGGAYTGSFYGGRFGFQENGSSSVVHGIGIKIDTPKVRGVTGLISGLYIADQKSDISGSGSVTGSSAIKIEGAGIENSIAFDAGDGSNSHANIYSPSQQVITINAPSGLNIAGPVTGTLNIFAGATASFGFTGRSRLASGSDGVILLSNNAVSNFSRLQFGGTTNLFMGLGFSGSTMALVAADGTIPTYASCTALTTNASGVIGCTVSDKRLKMPSGHLDGAVALLDKIPAAQLFSYKDKKRFDDKQHIGLYAQDVCNVVPLACAIRKVKGGVEYNYEDRAVIALLVKAVQEQRAVNDNLAVRLDKLEHRR